MRSQTSHNQNNNAMKNFLLALSLTLALGTTVSLNSCKKTTSTDDSQSAVDNTAVSNAMNNTSDDATSAAGQVGSISGKTDGWHHPLCGATAIDSGSANSNHLLTLTYDGTSNCNGVTRSGTVTVQLTGGTHWKDQGAVLTISFTNLVVTDIATGGHYTLTGTHVITNETGGLAWQVLDGIANGPVAHRHTGNLQITFADGNQRTWSIDRTRTFTNAGGIATIQLSSEATGNVDASGTNANGFTFVNSIPTPLVANSNPSCAWKVYQGEYNHEVANTRGRTVNIKFGVNASGAQIGSATTSATDCDVMGFLATFTVGNRTKTRFVGYAH
ncbi:MAG: hypothetical protein JWO06_929 [Bacteroidota bacterium]|nr:hypothetical protein [Bacteroidota bacterium]